MRSRRDGRGTAIHAAIEAYSRTARCRTGSRRKRSTAQ